MVGGRVVGGCVWEVDGHTGGERGWKDLWEWRLKTNLLCSSLNQAGKLQSVIRIRFRSVCMHVKTVLPGRHAFDLTHAFPYATSFLS
jgi:hypothetical protein